MKRYMKLDITKEKLKDLYINQEFSSVKIAKMFNVSSGTIRNYLRKFDIPLRLKMDSRHHYKNKTIELKDELLEIINGHLLGDGCIPRPKSKNTHVYFSLSSQYYNYAKLIFEQLEILRPKIRRKANIWSVKTKFVIDRIFWEKWYPLPIHKKRIPKDLVLTPKILLYWYIDDGYLCKKTGVLKLTNKKFTKNDIKNIILPQLKKILNSKNNDVHVYEYLKKGSEKRDIYIPKRYSKKFLEYIGPCPIECYKYKWDIKPYKRNYKYWSKEEINFVKENLDKSNKYLIKKLNRPYHSVTRMKRKIKRQYK